MAHVCIAHPVSVRDFPEAQTPNTTKHAKKLQNSPADLPALPLPQLSDANIVKFSVRTPMIQAKSLDSSSGHSLPTLMAYL